MKLLLLVLAKPMLVLSGATAFFWIRPSSEFRAVEAELKAAAEELEVQRAEIEQADVQVEIVPAEIDLDDPAPAEGDDKEE